MKYVLADTGPLYALADPSDQYHRRATSELTAIDREGETVVIAYPTLSEAHTPIMRRLGIGYGLKWLGEVLSGPVLVNAGASEYPKAAALLRKYSDVELTLVDALTAIIAASMNASIWTFDIHFRVLRASIRNG